MLTHTTTTTTTKGDMHFYTNVYKNIVLYFTNMSTIDISLGSKVLSRVK